MDWGGVEWSGVGVTMVVVEDVVVCGVCCLRAQRCMAQLGEYRGLTFVISFV